MNESANLAASVRARLLNRARARGEDFNYLLTRYANERLLYRLARSPHRERFVLKGAALFDVWGDWSHRASRDADLLDLSDDSAERMRLVFRDLAALDVAPDGIEFEPGSVSVAPIRERQWSALASRAGGSGPVEFESAVATLRRFLLPPPASAAGGPRFAPRWAAGGDWRD